MGWNQRVTTLLKTFAENQTVKNIKDHLTINPGSNPLLNRIVIPEALESTVLQPAQFGHLGITKIKTVLCSKVYFPNVSDKMEIIIK